MTNLPWPVPIQGNDKRSEPSAYEGTTERIRDSPFQRALSAKSCISTSAHRPLEEGEDLLELAEQFDQSVTRE